MTCNTSISSAAGLSSAFVATVGCGSPSETPTIWGTPLFLHTGFQQTKPHTSAESCFPLLGNIYPPSPIFHGSVSLVEALLPAAAPLGGSSPSPTPAPAQLYPAQLGAGTHHFLPLEKSWPSLFTGSQHTIPLLFVFAKRWAPASAGRHASNIEGINSCEWVNNDFPGGDEQHSHSSPGAWQGKVQCR